MSDLRSVRDTLLSISNPGQVLRFVDNEMDKVRAQGDMYELSSTYAWLKPLLEFYTEDLEGWVKFIKNVRDKLPRKSAEYADVRDFHKVVNVRNIQRRTRAMIDVATQLAIRTKKLKADDYHAKLIYAKRCVQAWGKRRDQMLQAIRDASPTGRVSVDHREELLAEFWDRIAREVNEGVIPEP